MASKFIKKSPQSLRRVNYDLRPMSGRETTAALKTSYAAQWLIELLETLENTTLYSGPLKYKAKQLKEELLKHAQRTVWSVAEGMEDVDPVDAMEQQEGGLAMLDGLFFIAMATDYVHEAQRSLFWLEIAKVFNRFNLPVAVSPDGRYEFLRNPEVEKGGAA